MCIYEKCFILLSCLIDNLAAFTMIVSKSFILRILRELLYHLLDLYVVAKKPNAFIFLDAFYVTLFISFLEDLKKIFFPQLSECACQCALGNLSFIILGP